MRKRKGNLLQRTMALLLSAALIAGMALEAVPLTVLAQENVGGGYNPAEESVIGNTVTEEATETESGEKESIPGSEEGAQESDEEKKEVDPATEKTEDTEEPEDAKKSVENPAAEGQDGVSEQEPAAEEEGADITDSNGVQPEKPSAPQKAVRAASAAVQAGEITPVTGEGWTIDENGKLTIESTAGMEHWSKYTEGLINPHESSVTAVEFKEAVTYLADNVFNGCDQLTSITIPESVESIGHGAFYLCRSLENITIPDGVTSIGAGAFEKCEKLTSIAIPDGVTEIYSCAFQGCTGLTSIVIPDSVTSIWEMTFVDCSNLTEITIPNSVISIGPGAFTGCSSLTEITIPGSVTSIEMGAFSECTSLTEVTIPGSVTSIGAGAFAGCSNLESVIMERSEPPALEEVQGQTIHFTGCKFETEKSKGIKVPTGTAATYKEAWEEWAEYITDGTDDTEDDLIASGEGWTLDSNGKLTIESDTGMDNWLKINGWMNHGEKVNSVEINSSVTSIGEHAFRQSKITSITIPDSVTAIGNYAFGECSELTSITIPDKVTNIGDNLFWGCSKLTSIIIPESVKSIGHMAFNGCTVLNNITIPSGVTEIQYGAFQGCTGLTAITIPANVTSIGHKAFQNCSSLETVTMERNTPPTLGATESGTKDHFTGCKFETEKTKGIKVPAGTAAAYKEAWPDWAEYITDGTDDTEEEFKPVTGKGWAIDKDGKLTIGSDAGMADWSQNGTQNYAKGVKSVEINSSVTGIGEYAFYESQITGITIPDSVTAIGRYAFGKCSALTSITIPNSVKTIGDHLFSGCTGLGEVTLPTGMTGIGDGMFEDCSGLKGITVPESVKSIGTWAFDGCGLETLTLPSGVTEIKYGAFRGCTGLTAITIPDRVATIGYMAFMNCSKLETVTMEGNTPPTLGVSSAQVKDHFTGCKFVTEDKTGIKVPAGTAAKYKEEWKEWEKYIAGDSAPATPTDEEKVAAAKQAVEKALADITVSNATTQESLAAAIQDAVKSALEAAGIDSSDVTVAVENFAKTEAATGAAGSITADIKITSGTESDSVPVSKTIDRLPGTPADKVAAVRKAVEEALKNAIDRALADTEVTNDNADKTAAQIGGLIPDALAEALKAAGVNAGDIEFGKADIQIEPAADREGSITVTIPVTSNEDASLSESASVQVPVMKPGGEENPGQEAEEAKKAVEEALKNIPVTNDTTKEDILAALKEELGDKAGAEAIEKFEKTDATEDAPGKISLSIRITINGKTVTVHVTVTIAQLARRTGVYIRFMDQYDMDGTTPRYRYTGLAIRPSVRVYNNEELLAPGTDYTVGYKNNTKPGTAALTVKGKGRFSGTSDVVSFTIINADIEKDTEHPTEMTVIANTKVAPVIMNGTKKLTTKDYRLEGEGLAGNKYAAATAEGETRILTVKGAGSYEGSSFNIKVKVIEKRDAGKLSVKVDSKFRPVYDGNALDLGSLFQKPQDSEGTDTAAGPQEPAGAITVTDAKDRTKILEEGTDFTVQCTSDLVNAGTVRFTLTGMGAYAGSVTKSFKISPLKVTDSSRFSVTFDGEKTYEYRAAGTEVDGLVVKYLGETDQDTDDRILRQGVDYKVTYSNNKKVSGTKDAVLKVTFLGSYKGSSAVQKTFKIVPAKLSSANTVVTVPDKVYKKAAQAYKSVPIVTVDGTAVRASGYTVSYAWATESEAADDTKYVKDDKVKITLAEGDTWAKVRVTVTPKETGSYGLAEGAVLAGEYYVRKADNAVNLSKAKVTFYNREGTQLKWLEYNGNTFHTPAGNNAEAENALDDPNAVYVKVTVGGAVVDPSLYDVTWTSARDKGKATVVIRGRGTATDKGMAVGSRNQAVTIKAMVLKGKNLKPYVEDVADMMNSIKSLFYKKQ